MAHDSRTQVQRCQILGSFSASDRSSALFDSCKIIGKYWSSARETMSLNRCVVVLGEFNIAHGSTANLTQNTFVNYSNQDRAVVFLNIGDPNRCSIINNIFISMQNSNQMIWIAQGADSSEFDIHQNCIYGFESIWAELSYVRFDIATNNILADPRLVSLEPLDAHLRENSPCIDAGDPQIFWDEDNTPPDIGAYWFDQLDVFQHATQITRESSNILFPNPTNGIIHINYTLNSSEIVTFSIYNTEGRRINTNWIIQANSGRNHSILNIPLLPTGMYFVVMKNNGSDSVFPIQLIR